MLFCRDDLALAFCPTVDVPSRTEMESSPRSNDALLRWRSSQARKDAKKDESALNAETQAQRRQKFVLFFKSPWFAVVTTLVLSASVFAASLHHHSQQAPAHHAAPPAHKTSTAPVESTYLDHHESGIAWWQDIDTSKSQVLKKHIKFEKPFRKPPSVLLSPSFLVPNAPEEAWSYGRHGISKEGFWVYYSTWGTPAYHTFQLHWIAVGR